MKKIKLDDGLQLEIQDNATDDMELLDDLVQIDEGKGYMMGRVLERLLGKEGKKQVYEHYRENGKVPITKVSKALNEIFDKIGDNGKNS